MFDSIIQWAKNLGNKPVADFDTVGPNLIEHHLVYWNDLVNLHQKLPAFNDGWWYLAKQTPANPGRVGGTISPHSLVVHTTDMLDLGNERRQYDAIIRSWTGQRGNGACAHFLFGRNMEQGCVQFVPITKNGNHAGGPIHGNYRSIAGSLIHPNLVTVGVELSGGGKLDRKGDSWIHRDSKRTVPQEEVYIDERGKGWHRVTDYQLEALGLLIEGLKFDREWSAKVVPDGDYKANGVDYYAPVTKSNVVLHATLDPVNKTDPGPQVAAWLRKRGYMV